MGILVLSREQVRNCDKVAIERYGVAGIVLMENASLGAADEILKMINDGDKVCIVAGGGNNGGDGFAVARHLYNEGIAVTVVILVAREKIGGDALTNLEIIEKMGVDIHWDCCLAEEIAEADVVVDAMLGTGMTGAVRGKIADAIKVINGSGKLVVALDIPSGLDCDSGEALGPAIKANKTVTFVAIKKGFIGKEAVNYTGEVVVKLIGIKAELLI